MIRPDINFSNDDSHAFLPWVIGVMVGLATLLLCLGLTVDTWIIRHHEHYENSLTVTIPATTEDLETKLKLVRDTLQNTKGISAISELGDDELQAMLKTWLGNGESVDSLPLPTVLEVITDGSSKVDYKELQAKLNILAAGTEVSSHDKWVASFSDFSTALEGLIALLAALIILSVALTIAFTSRASLKLHTKTVGLLHSIGAEDRYIARQFQHDAFWLTLRGTLPGVLIAGLSYWGTGFYMESLQSSMFPSFAMHMEHFVLLAIMPIACGVVSLIAARLSILQQLHYQL